MTVYVYSEQQIERMVGKSRRLRIRSCVAAIVILFMAVLLAFYRPSLPIFHEPVRAWMIALLTSFFLFPLARTIWRWRSWQDLMRNSLRETRVEVASGTVDVSDPCGYKGQLRLSEIVRAEEPYWGTGLYLRTSNRYRWILIPRELDGYESIRRELAVAGATVLKRLIPTNGEEFVLVLLFIGTILCATMVHDTRILLANLVIAVIGSVSGFLIVNANPDNHQIRRARIGVFIPVVFAALGFLLRH
jgi:multisubunit Na+/H+ antiporter MnhG subunit